MDLIRTFGRDLDLGSRDNIAILSCGFPFFDWEAKDAPKGNAHLFRIVQENRNEKRPLLMLLQDPRLAGLQVCVHPTDEPSDWKDSMLTVFSIPEHSDVVKDWVDVLVKENVVVSEDAVRQDMPSQSDIEQLWHDYLHTNLVPGEWDVLFGRGMRIHRKPGNVRFHRILHPMRERYKQAPRDQKAVIVQQAIRVITSSWMIPGGNSETRVRFLKRAPINGHENSMQGQQEGTGSWILASENEVFEKVRHVLRDPKPVKLTTRKKLPTGHQRVLPQEEEQLMNAAGAPIHSRFSRNMPGVYVLVPVSSEEISNSEPPMPDLQDESLRLTDEELHFLDDLYNPELDGSSG